MLDGLLDFGASIVNGVVSAVGASKQRKWEEKQAAQQQQWNEQMMDKQNQFNVNMWNAQNEYNTPLAQKQRMEEAGYNPMYYGPDGTANAGGVSAASPLGYERATNVQNPLQAGLEGFMSMRSLQKDIELKNAQIDKLHEDATGVKLDNQWKDMTMDARAEAEKLGNDLTKEQIGKVKSEKSQIEQNIKKLAAETEHEAFKQLLTQAQIGVQKANEKSILEMLPYEKLLKEAQTNAQKMSAMASYYNALTQKGLLDAGYIDKYIDSMVADSRLKNANASNQELMAEINNFKAAIKSGNIFETNNPDAPVTNALGKIMNGFFQDISILGEALTGGLSGILK